jgi:hypothetical protein
MGWFVHDIGLQRFGKLVDDVDAAGDLEVCQSLLAVLDEFVLDVRFGARRDHEADGDLVAGRIGMGDHAGGGDSRMFDDHSFDLGCSGHWIMDETNRAILSWLERQTVESVAV